MPDKNLVIDLNGRPNDPRAVITRRRKVFFFPADSDHKVKVCFDGVTGELPFSDWDSDCRTGRKGKPLTGRVHEGANGTFGYVPESIPRMAAARIKPRANPQLIVDGGGEVVPPKRKRKSHKLVARKK